jgi:hypothetical protein
MFALHAGVNGACMGTFSYNPVGFLALFLNPYPQLPKKPFLLDHLPTPPNQATIAHLPTYQVSNNTAFFP